MTYIDYLNDFNQWLEDDNPTDKAVVLYYGLLSTFNRRGWPRWAGVDTQRLMILARTSDKKVAFRARDVLVKAGFLQYKSGKKGTATEYRLLKFGGKSTTENATENATESDTESDTENATPNKTKTKTKTKNFDDDEEESAREGADEGLARVMTEYMERIDPSPSPTSLDLLKIYVQSLGPEVCLRAIYRACDAGARKWTYIYAVLKNCAKDGIRCLADWDRKEEERRGHNDTAGGGSSAGAAEDGRRFKSAFDDLD